MCQCLRAYGLIFVACFLSFCFIGIALGNLSWGSAMNRTGFFLNKNWVWGTSLMLKLYEGDHTQIGTVVDFDPTSETTSHCQFGRVIVQGCPFSIITIFSMCVLYFLESAWVSHCCVIGIIMGLRSICVFRDWDGKVFVTFFFFFCNILEEEQCWRIISFPLFP